MSRPQPIDFRLHSWSIEYESEYFDSDRTGTYHYMAHVNWVANQDPKSMKTSQMHRTQKTFTSFELAKEWVDKEVDS